MMRINCRRHIVLVMILLLCLGITGLFFHKLSYWDKPVTSLKVVPRIKKLFFRTHFQRIRAGSSNTYLLLFLNVSLGLETWSKTLVFYCSLSVYFGCLWISYMMKIWISKDLKWIFLLSRGILVTLFIRSYRCFWFHHIEFFFFMKKIIISSIKNFILNWH